MPQETNEQIEKRIAAKVVREILDVGCKISVSDGNYWVIKGSTDESAILQVMFTTGGDTLSLSGAVGNRVGFVSFIWGNGVDCISDHTENDQLRDIMDPIQNWIEETFE